MQRVRSLFRSDEARCSTSQTDMSHVIVSTKGNPSEKLGFIEDEEGVTFGVHRAEADANSLGRLLVVMVSHYMRG